MTIWEAFYVVEIREEGSSFNCILIVIHLLKLNLGGVRQDSVCVCNYYKSKFAATSSNVIPGRGTEKAFYECPGVSNVSAAQGKRWILHLSIRKYRPARQNG